MTLDDFPVISVSITLRGVSTDNIARAASKFCSLKPAEGDLKTVESKPETGSQVQQNPAAERNSFGRSDAQPCSCVNGMLFALL